MRFLDLFAGVGGLSLGLERAGMTCVGHVEIDPYAQKVLKKHWPHVPLMADVREVKGDEFGTVDLICGGFPCQPHSLAGKRRASEDERDLWGEYARIIGAVKPRWVLAENVPGLLSSEAGRFFGRVLRDLAALGYDAEWTSIRASDFGAHHKRERVFLVAYPEGKHSDVGNRYARVCVGRKALPQLGNGSRTAHLGNPASERLPDWAGGTMGQPKPLTEFERPGGREVERDVRGVAYGVSKRVDRLRALGNAVVPQVAEYMGRLIMEADA